MKIIVVCQILLAAIIAECACSVDSDIQFQDKLKFFHEILNRVEQPLRFQKWIQSGEHLLVDKELYTEWTEQMENVHQAAQKGKLLGKHEFFGALIMTHHQQMLGLYDFLKNSLAWEHFVQNACWARQHVNAHMFVYAFKMSTLARSESNGLYMPRIYEIMPVHFYNKNFVKSAKEFKTEIWTNIASESIEQFPNETNHESWQWWRQAGINATSWYGIYNGTSKIALGWWQVEDYTRELGRQQQNKDSILRYLTEDNDWNAYWYELSQLTAFPVDGGYNRWLCEERAAEFWFHFLQQYLLRYRLERLSHELGPIPDLADWDAKIHFGYAPEMIALNGEAFSVRPDNWIPTQNEQTANFMKEVYDTWAYIRQAIVEGQLIMRNGTELNLRAPQSAHYVYDLLRGHKNANGKFFHLNWYAKALMYFANVAPSKPGQLHTNVRPHVLLNFETMPREPFFYVFHQEIINLKHNFESHLPPYSQRELHVNGIEVLAMDLSAELNTFDAIARYDVKNLLPAAIEERIFARRMHLNHMSEGITLKIKSSKIREVIIRLYLAPKLDEYGRALGLEENRHNFMHLNTVSGKLQTGENLLNFSLLTENNILAEDPTNSSILPVKSKHCNLAGNLLLPRGRVPGLPMLLFVHVLDKDGQHDVIWWRSCSPARVYGTQSLGYPFDRAIRDEQAFLGSNMFFKDIKIGHKFLTESSLKS